MPVSNRFFTTVADYLNTERPAGVDTDRVFVTLKGPTRGEPLSVKGMEQVMRDARQHMLSDSRQWEGRRSRSPGEGTKDRCSVPPGLASCAETSEMVGSGRLQM